MLEFDPAKDAENIRKHGVGLARFAEMDPSTAIFTKDDRFDYREVRYTVTGDIDGVLHVAVVTLRGEVYRVISLRRANARERKYYVEEI